MENKSDVKREIESLMKKEAEIVNLSSDKALLKELLDEAKTITDNLQNLHTETKTANENVDSILSNLEDPTFDRDYNKFDRDYNKFDRDYNKFDRDYNKFDRE